MPETPHVQQDAATDRCGGPPAKRQKLDQSSSQEAIEEDSGLQEGNGQARSHAETLTDVPTVDANGKPLSKNQIKKARRKAAWEAGREDRKAKRRIKTQERKERKRADPEKYSRWREEKRNEALQSRNGTVVPLTIIYDCNYDDLMTDNERMSLGTQLTRAYSDNRRAKWKSHMVISSWGGKLRERFEGLLERTHEGWKGVRFFEEDFPTVIQKADEWMRGTDGGIVGGFLSDSTLKKADFQEEVGIQAANGNSDYSLKTVSSAGDEPRNVEKQIKGEIVYLSSDSPNTLTRLKPYSTYIIGGLVDKNRHKGACYKAACDAGIQTAKLPIGQFMQMQSRQVLATSHVGEIMLKWVEYGDWGKAFMAVIPKRKGGTLKEDGEQALGVFGDEELDTHGVSVVRDDGGTGLLEISSANEDEDEDVDVGNEKRSEDEEDVVKVPSNGYSTSR